MFLDVDECVSEPCINAVSCVNLAGSYQCRCRRGWTGRRCDHNINDCVGQCQHGATCIDLVNDYHCACQPGYTGNIVQHYIILLQSQQILIENWNLRCTTKTWWTFRERLRYWYQWLRLKSLPKWRRMRRPSQLLQMHLSSWFYRLTVRGKIFEDFQLTNKTILKIS